jgi:outer membrane protein OmpA-like peptidoglycan-associated protein
MKIFFLVNSFLLLLTATSLNAQSKRQSTPSKQFAPGTIILFEDNFQECKEGEFPPNWSLINGSAKIKIKENKNVCFITQGEYNKPVLKPNLKKENYLPASFSAEFDFYPEENNSDIHLYFKVSKNNYTSIHLGSWVATRDFYSDALYDWRYFKSHPYPKLWHHIAVTFINGDINGYVDAEHPMRYDSCGFIPLEIAIGGSATKESPIIFKNFKLAEIENKVNFNSILTEGKLVTHTIYFDVNKSTIKTESMTFLIEMVTWMNANSKIKLEIGGHTDSDGNDRNNLKLSKARAHAVKTKLVSMGIHASRLTTKGYGETKPISDNNTIEGKANNRRVEFTKI